MYFIVYVFIFGFFGGFCLFLLINCDKRYYGISWSVLNVINGGLIGMVSICILIEKIKV